MWKARGVEPFAVLGHSVGEYTAAVVAGTMSLMDGLRIVVRRAQLIDERCDEGLGMMASIFAPQADVEEARLLAPGLCCCGSSSTRGSLQGAAEPSKGPDCRYGSTRLGFCFDVLGMLEAIAPKAVNGPSQVVVSGHKTAVEQLVSTTSESFLADAWPRA
ncbi:mdpG [Symbiodinium sp. CCMP2456]|nr:mdpG [Symbiodinium sp. CCMP2456]